MPPNNKIALVLGGTGRLGSVIAKRLAREGCRVYATYKSENRSQHTAPLPDTVKLIRTDATDEHQVELLFETVIAESKKVHIVGNSVRGCLPRKPLTEVTAQEWDLMMNINL
jgi:NAD(P)-dependent dehydrogenase (short-subunit alcohol dehydrogenase family)